MRSVALKMKGSRLASCRVFVGASTRGGGGGKIGDNLSPYWPEEQDPLTIAAE